MNVIGLLLVSLGARIMGIGFRFMDDEIQVRYVRRVNRLFQQELTRMEYNNATNRHEPPTK